jgi:hypothetical protein
MVEALLELVVAVVSFSLAFFSFWRLLLRFSGGVEWREFFSFLCNELCCFKGHLMIIVLSCHQFFFSLFSCFMSSIFYLLHVCFS